MALSWGNWRVLHIQNLQNNLLKYFIVHFDKEILFILPSFMISDFLIEKLQMAAALFTLWMTKMILGKDINRNN